VKNQILLNFYGFSAYFQHMELPSKQIMTAIICLGNIMQSLINKTENLC